LREAADAIEAEGVKRARARGAEADVVIAVGAAPAPVFPDVSGGARVIYVVTKSDLMEFAPLGFLAVSARTGAGMAELVKALAHEARRLTDVAGAPALGRPRQVACVRETCAALGRAVAAEAPELRGEELRIAAAALGRLTGVIGVEEILDAVFSGFCIGK
jgi:tRNA modification GTPase